MGTAMLTRRTSLLSTLALPFLVACGSSNGGGTPGPTSTLDLGGKACNLSTQFPGDDRCITAPAPEAGMQFHYGPTNYGDATEVGKYTLKPGEEVTDCDYYITPNEATVYFNAYHARMRPGSHHMLLFIESQNSQTAGLNAILGGAATMGKFTPTGNQGPDANCNPGIGTRNLFGAQTPITDANALVEGAAEDEGIAVEIPPKQNMTIQAHFINATSAPILREVWANILFTPKDQVTQLGDPIFFIGGVGMNVPMGSSQVITGYADVPTGVSPDFRLVIGTGHYHSHTTEFKAWKTQNGVKTPLIHDYNTLGHAPDPTTWFFASAVHNPEPSDVSGVSGAYSGIVHLQPGDQISWECDVTNNDQAAGLQFGNYVYKAEMCNMFGLYAPSIGKAWQSACPVQLGSCLSL
jgi:hypothetical protein